jgi:Tfp pilus assembly protein PilF
MVDEAHAHLSKALSSNPNNALALGLMAEIELQRGDSDKSMTYAKRLQKNRPDLYQGHKLEGDVWLKRKEYAKASTAYNRAWAKQQTATLSIAMFRASIPSSTVEEALEPALTWLQANPEDTATRFLVATAYLENDRTEAAAREYEKILEQAPETAAVLNNRAGLYSKNNDPRALEMAKRAYQSTPENPGIQDTYGWILVQNGQLEKGIRLLSQALDQLPGNADVRYHYAAALMQSGKTGEGSKLLEKLLAEGKPFSGQADAKRLLAKYKASR